MRATTLALLALAATTVAAQAVPNRVLEKPDAEWAEPLSQISGVRELRDGRVIVSDAREKTIQLVDFRNGAKKIGREGSGPGEYGLPGAMFAAPGDTTWVFDLLNSRYLVIDPAGTAVSTFTIANSIPPSSPSAVRPGGTIRSGFGVGFAQGIDAQGRLYFRAPTTRFTADGLSVGDSTPIVRWDRRTERADTVAVLVSPPSRPAAVPRATSGGSQQVSVRIGGGTPFVSADAYAVTSQGDLAVVRAKDYHVDWISKGRTVAGAPIRYDRVKVTEDDKRAYMEGLKTSTATMVANINGQRSVQNMPAAGINGADAPVFPDFKGPFSSVTAGPNNQIWVQKYMPNGAPPTYDVIDPTGKVVSRVVLPKRTRLLGFGRGTLYLARSDEDDLQYLQRYRWQ
jgi:hypothetical protein